MATIKQHATLITVIAITYFFPTIALTLFYNTVITYIYLYEQKMILIVTF